MNFEILCPIPTEGGRPLYFQGDIVGVEGHGTFQSLSYAAIEPQTRLYHFLLIGPYIASEDDYMVLESIGKGVAIGRLSWYSAETYEVFRVNHRGAARLGAEAFEKASKFGRMNYDYLLFLKFFADAAGHSWSHLIREGRIPRMTPADFHLVENASFICTEFVVATWDLVNVHVIDPGDAAIPAAFILASRSGRIIPIDFHRGTQARQAFRIGFPYRGTRVPLHRSTRVRIPRIVPPTRTAI